MAEIEVKPISLFVDDMGDIEPKRIVFETETWDEIFEQAPDDVIEDYAREIGILE